MSFVVENNDDGGKRTEIAFFDLETTMPTRPGQGYAILEFGSILVCPRKLVELHSYSTLVKPIDPIHISTLSARPNGITHQAVSSAPSFHHLAHQIFDILDGRIWAGHNILRFDCKRIDEAFAEIGRPPPQPTGFIDTLHLLTKRFGKRAGDMKMASLANYFSLGRQTHRSLDDVRMNLEVVKHCATVLFLESSLPDIFTPNNWISPNATTRSRSIAKSSSPGSEINKRSPPSRLELQDPAEFPQNHPILSLITSTEEVSDTDASNMSPLSESLKTKSLQVDVSVDETLMCAGYEACSDDAGFLDPNQISLAYISASFVPWLYGIQRIQLFHNDVPMQLHCPCLRVRYGISTKFLDNNGRAKLNVVVDAPLSLCRVLEACDRIAKEFSVESDSSSEWKDVVSVNKGYFGNPTARLHIPTVVNEDNTARYGTEIYQKEASGVTQLVFSKFDPAELQPLLKPGTFVDAFFSFETYDFQQNAGIRLIAHKLIVLPM
ncbi:hypothetical protein ACFE04_014354 [Oxalis oulophora]